MLSPVNKIYAQNLDSTNYTLLAPTFDSISGIANSTNYSTLNGSSPVDEYTITSTTYQATGGTGKFVEANVPSITCFETSTTSGTTTCTGVPGGNGMQGVCSQPGCYDRAKVEINTQNNPADTRYALQVSTTSDFSSGIFYVTGSTHIIKNTALLVSDFLFKCEWEGTISVGYCAATNTTWQKYDILGLTPGTTYYVRSSALHGSSTDGSFTQSAWGPSATVATQNTSVALDVDIATSTAGSSSPPYILTMTGLIPGVVYTSNEYIIFRLTTNALNGIQMQIKGLNGGLLNSVTSSQINAVNADLAGVTSGYGLRNDSTTNSQINSGYIGTITVSSTPSDFTDSGAAAKVGAPTTTFVKLFDSNSLPLDTGVTGYKVKVKSALSQTQGVYSETITFVPTGSF